MSTISGVARRSFYPERHLVRQRDTYALYAKYLFGRSAEGLSVRSRSLFDFSPAIRKDESHELKTYKTYKQLGCLVVGGAEPAKATGKDAQQAVTIRRGDPNVITLHLEPLSSDAPGPNQLRHDMGTAATYIRTHAKLRNREHVIGVTYEEMARVAGRVLGFRQMQVEDVDPTYRLELTAVQQVFCALNGVNQADRPLRPAMVYLPTAELLTNFAPEPLSSLPPQPAPANQAT